MTKYKEFKPEEYRIYQDKCWSVFGCPSCYALLNINQKDGITECTCGQRYKISAILFHVKEETD
jgi:hypothetical protein